MLIKKYQPAKIYLEFLGKSENRKEVKVEKN